MSEIIHECKKSILANGYYYLKKQNNNWLLFNWTGELIHENCVHCMWCNKLLEEEIVFDTKTSVVNNKLHRCQKMIEIEKKRNTKKPAGKNDRSYVIEHNSSTGWTLMNNNKKTWRDNLKECPFCFCFLPLFNQVIIE